MKTQVKLNSRIYPEAAIQRAVKDYLRVMQLAVIKKPTYYQISIPKKANSSNSGVILKEFTNYVLGLTKKCL